MSFTFDSSLLNLHTTSNKYCDRGTFNSLNLLQAQLTSLFLLFYHPHSSDVSSHWTRTKYFLVTQKFHNRKTLIRQLTIAFFPNVMNYRRTHWLAGGYLLLSINNHLNNVSGLNLRLLNRRLVTKQLSAVEPALWKYVDVLLSLRTKKYFGIVVKVQEIFQGRLIDVSKMSKFPRVILLIVGRFGSSVR